MNPTYFWICYDEFWNNVKDKTSNMWNRTPILKFIDEPQPEFIHINNVDLHDLFLQINIFKLKLFLINNLHILKILIPTFYFGIVVLIGYILYKKAKFVYHCYKTKTLKVTFLNWLFDPEISFTISKLGIFYSIIILSLLGILYTISGEFFYWLHICFVVECLFEID